MKHKLITIEKEYVLEKLYSLVQLCQKTDITPTEIISDQLFNGYMLSAQQMFDLTEQEYGLNDHFELSNMMRQANKLWKIMNRIKNGEKVYKVILENELEDFIIQGQKINAIKHYRHVMDETFDTEITLKGAKEYVDALAEDMRRRGVIK